MPTSWPLYIDSGFAMWIGLIHWTIALRKAWYVTTHFSRHSWLVHELLNMVH
ncbi:MAG: hypothetical protein ACSLEN_06525 [Candidatus Malihini olakiniferum]